MRNPHTSYAELIAFAERIARCSMFGEWTEEARETLTLQEEVDFHDDWVTEARRLTGEKYIKE